ncbi:hypothetical protein ACW2Q0_16750 [Nocardia sp. R16R-3T]
MGRPHIPDGIRLDADSGLGETAEIDAVVVFDDARDHRIVPQVAHDRAIEVDGRHPGAAWWFGLYPLR